MTPGWRINRSESGGWLVMATLAAAGWLGLTLLAGGPAAAADSVNRCEQTSRDVLRSCRYGARSDYWLARGKCDNLPTPAERKACREQAAKDLEDALDECNDQFDERQDICEDLGGAPYNPVIDPANFVSRIDNPYLPMKPGTTFIYEGKTDEGLERVEVSVTDRTKKILGVTCVEVRDTGMLDGELVEDTLDWFAQDKDGNVWYFGENSLELEDGLIVSVEGSWEAGVDGAKPGIIMEAHPRVGDVYRQEFSLEVAEDMAEVLSLKESVKVPFGSFKNCLQTEEFTPLSPGSIEHKFYAAGVGLLLELSPESGERLELIEIRK